VLLFPAIALRGGRVVRLEQGDFGREQVYGSDPLEVAKRFVDAGVEWIHIVDLDAAKSDGNNRQIVADIARALGTNVKLQTGGGVRSLDDAQQLADAGVARVVMGSAAVRDPGLVDAVAAIVNVAVGLDHRNGEVAVDGWLRGSSLRLTEAVTRYPAAAAFVITDISRDGMLTGPDTEGLRHVASLTATPIIASGGVGSLDDLRALREVRSLAGAQVHSLAGIIVGKAIYEGRFTVAEATRVLRA